MPSSTNSAFPVSQEESFETQSAPPILQFQKNQQILHRLQHRQELRRHLQANLQLLWSKSYLPTLPQIPHSHRLSNLHSPHRKLTTTQSPFAAPKADDTQSPFAVPKADDTQSPFAAPKANDTQSPFAAPKSDDTAIPIRSTKS